MTSNEIEPWVNDIHQGDAFDVLELLPACSVHAVVTDPPYAEGDYSGFMGQAWDSFDGPKEFQEWNERWARLAFRVLKPGSHVLAFGSDDAHHRTQSGIEDAGFEIRTTITFHYGQGMPKGLDVATQIDTLAGAEDQREVIETRTDSDITGGNLATSGAKDTDETIEYEVTAPATETAKEWDGWKTGLKPATEFITVARKPLEGTVVENVLEHGTGALNIGERIIEYESDLDREKRRSKNPGTDETVTSDVYSTDRPQQTDNHNGRHPANVVFDEIAARWLDESVGELAGGARTPQSHTGRNTSDHPTRNDPDRRIQLDGGGPSRYFYTSKATVAERSLNGRIVNDHPTVKPEDLMEWLVGLVTATGQVVLDPFAGSGTTCRAAKNIGRQFIGIERDPRFADIARVRTGLEPDDPSIVREDGPQAGLETFLEGSG